MGNFDKITRRLMDLIEKRHRPGRFGSMSIAQQENMAPTGPGAMGSPTNPMMMSMSGGGKVPWQKGKALEDYMMKKLRNRDNEEFYKNSPVFGGKPKGITSPGPDPSGMGDPTGTDTPRPLQDYGDWDEQDSMFPNMPRPYRNPVFDTMPQNKTRRQF
jgi:hypothetical protein